MAAALQYLGFLFQTSDAPSVIFLQEICSQDLSVIGENEWVQCAFHVTDISAERWPSSYGTVTLIDHRLSLLAVFRVRFDSHMGRGVLFTDIEISGKTSRLCNTHLESLVATPPLRPAQVALASKHLHQTKAGI